MPPFLIPPSKSSLIKGKNAAKSARRTGKGKQASIKVPVEVVTVIENLTREQELRLRGLAASLVEPGKGILAVDESTNTVDNCLRCMKLDGTESNRARYLEAIIGEGRELRHYVSGILVTEDLSKLKLHRGRGPAALLQSVPIQLGIRVDRQFVKIPGTFSEWATSGLDTLDDNCQKFKDKGATFALWRCVYKVTSHTPSDLALTINSNSMARFASVCQAAGLVPIVSAELLPDGDYDLQLAEEALRAVLSALVTSLHFYHVFLEGVIIRLTPAFPGVGYPGRYKLAEVVRATLQTCNNTIPAAVAGIMLCRRESLEDSAQVLNELNKFPMKKPYAISFCYSRVVHNEVIKLWAGQDSHLPKARNLLLERAKMCSLSSMGQHPEHNQSLFISSISGQ